MRSTKPLARTREPSLQPLSCNFCKCCLLCPQTLIRDMAEAVSDPKLVIGAQTFHWSEEGEFAGELSTALLRLEGARIVLVGHAERRLLFGQTNEIASKKMKRAFADGFTVVLCVGDAGQLSGQRGAPSTVE